MLTFPVSLVVGGIHMIQLWPRNIEGSLQGSNGNWQKEGGAITFLMKNTCGRRDLEPVLTSSLYLGHGCDVWSCSSPLEAVRLQSDKNQHPKDSREDR